MGMMMLDELAVNFFTWWLGRDQPGLSTGHASPTHHKSPSNMGINACTLIYLGTAHNYERKLSTSK